MPGSRYWTNVHCRSDIVLLEIGYLGQGERKNEMSRVYPSLHWACVGMAIVALGAPYAAVAENILLLYDERRELPGLSAFDESFARTLSSEASDSIFLYREDMDLSRFDFADYRLRLRDHLRAKYADTRIDAVVAVMGPALDFALRHGTAFAPGAPIVFAGVDTWELHDRVLPDHVTGVLLERRFAPTVELASDLCSFSDFGTKTKSKNGKLRPAAGEPQEARGPWVSIGDLQRNRSCRF